MCLGTTDCFAFHFNKSDFTCKCVSAQGLQIVENNSQSQDVIALHIKYGTAAINGTVPSNETVSNNNTASNNETVANNVTVAHNETVSSNTTIPPIPTGKVLKHNFCRKCGYATGYTRVQVPLAKQ